MKQLLDYIGTIADKRLEPTQVRMMNPLVLAYIGDTVYDLFVRTFLVHTLDASVHQLHIYVVWWTVHE